MLLSLTVLFTLLINTLLINAEDETIRKIVVFAKNIDSEKKNDLLKNNHAVKLKELSCINAVVAIVPKNSKFNKSKEVLYVECDNIVSITEKGGKKTKVKPVPIPETIPWGIVYVGAPEVWQTSTGDSIKVGVIDTGIDMDHPDLIANIKGGFNVLKKYKSPDDDNGHGTHVSGIIAAVANEIGVVGVLPDADLYAVKVLDRNGNGYVSDLIEGINWCIENEIDILNMSLGISSYSESLHNIIVQAEYAGITMVVAAGNNFGGVAEYPAAYPEVISVGAIDKNGSIADFSAVENVDVFAPGVNIFSTYDDDNYVEMDGTSMVCPYVVVNVIMIE